ncbi:MAG: Stp1/IreP family PP2C-type Ser/Thr phosphatase [Chthonomonadales bacterium]
MSDENVMEVEATATEAAPEITAKFTRDELVRGWPEREPRSPKCVPIVKFGAKTDLGRVRENNEDKFDFYEVSDPTLLAHRGSFYAVADGMGGHAGGQFASELALKNVIFNYYSSETDDVAKAVLEAFTFANDQIYGLAQANPERNGMGTTLSALFVKEDRVYVGQIGDSRAYLIRDGEIRQVTFDHSWVAEQVRAGILTEEEAETSPYRNIITRSMGTGALIEPDVFVEEAHPGDIWVICSDGLTGHVNADEIRLVALTQLPCETARQLIELASARGGRDNITVFCIHIVDVWQNPDAANGSGAHVATPEAVEAAPADERNVLKRIFGKS